MVMQERRGGWGAQLGFQSPLTTKIHIKPSLPPYLGCTEAPRFLKAAQRPQVDTGKGVLRVDVEEEGREPPAS